MPSIRHWFKDIIWDDSCLLAMVHCIAYNCSNKNAEQRKGVSFFRLPKDHALRLTWFKKLRLVNPPDTENVRVCSEHFAKNCFIYDMQVAMGYKKSKRSLAEDAVPTLFSFNKPAVLRMFPEGRANRAHTETVGGIYIY